MPIHVTPARARRGRSARVFGMFRTAPYDTPIPAQVQFPRRGDSPGSGRIRILWTNPASRELAASRAQRAVRR